MSKRLWSASCFFLATALAIYGLKRYNGYDLESYFTLVEAFGRGGAPYGEKPLSLYPPSGVYALQVLKFFPKKWVHLVCYGMSILLFLRVSFIGFSLFQPKKKNTANQILFFLIVSWLAIMQGLGAQLEGGNINLLLMYLLFEGVYLIQKKPECSLRFSLGLLMCWLPVVFKPYLGLVSCGVTLWMVRRFSWKWVGIPVLAFLIIGFGPMLFKGIQLVIVDYQNWLKGDVHYVDCAFTLKCNAVNYSILSYFYHIHSWTLESLFWVLIIGSALSLGYSIFERNLLKLFSVLCLVTFLISPASFPYTLMLLWFPILWATRLLVLEPQQGNYFLKSIALLFLGALIFLNPTYIGREFFNQVIVPYRVTSFFVMLGLIPLLARKFDPPR